MSRDNKVLHIMELPAEGTKYKVMWNEAPMREYILKFG